MLHSIPDALAALSAYRQFCLYYTAPHPKTPGKLQKFPCDVHGHRRDAHDPSIWITFSEAVQHAASRGAPYGVAFVLTSADPFFFIDIDGCLVDGQWSQLAVDMCAAFSGCAVEVSSSGRGLHIIGTANVGAHSCTNRRAKSLGLELYTEKRFIALTGTGVVGDVLHTPPAASIAWAVGEFFPPHAAGESGEDFEWSDGPVEEWNGPTDDDELIRRACASVSTDAAFGVKAAFFDLWTGNADVLARAFPPSPDSTSGMLWDGNAADMALAAHLAFWTGKDCERIQRLMMQSGIARDKYERADYLPRTISRVVNGKSAVLTDRPPALPAIAPAPVTAGVTPSTFQFFQARIIEDSTYLTPEQQIDVFRGCVYVRDVNRVLTPSGELLKREVFNSAYGGFSFVMDQQNGRISRDAWEAFTQSQVVRHPQAMSTCFRPMLPFGAILTEQGVTSVNTFLPVDVPHKPGDASVFLTHLRNLIPDDRDREILLSYMCACVQHKGVKFKWTPLVQGVEGNGKTVLSQCVAYAIGNRYVHWPKASKLTNQFNSWMVGKLFYAVEDIYTPKNKIENFEELKTMVTGDKLEIEGKGVDQVSREVCGNFMLNSNHKNAVAKTRNDRRVAPFYTAQQNEPDLARDGMGAAYMGNLFDWLKGDGRYADEGLNHGLMIVAELLMTRPIAPEFNPAGECQRAPRTTSTGEAIELGLGTVEQSVLEAIDRHDVGFRGGWVSSRYLDDLFERKGIKFSPSYRDQVMRTLGYERHPNLTRGRVNNPVMPDAGRSLLYVRTGGDLARIDGATAIAKAYEIAQSENLVDAEVNRA